MGESISTTDLYEATFYLLGGCELLGIEAARVNGGVSCRLSLRGSRLEELQAEYFGGRAKVSLFAFRRMFGQVNALVYSAKKKAKSQLRQQPAAEGGGL